MTQQHGAWADEEDLDGADDRNDSTAMRELRKADRAKAKRIAELEGQLAERSKADRDRAMQEVLQTRNLNPKIAGLIPSDVEPSTEAIGKWLDDYGDVFGVPQQQDAESSDRDRQVAQMRQMDDFSGEMAPPAAGSDMAARINSVTSKEELDALIFGGGAG